MPPITTSITSANALRRPTPAARFQPARGLALGLLIAALAGCNAAPDATAQSASTAASKAVAQPDAKPMHDTQQNIPAIAPPSPGAVLDAIYDERGDGSDSYEVANGSVASFWYGYEFDFGGKRYYSGFAYATPEKYGKDRDEDLPAPDAQVTLSQATFERSGDAAQPWTLLGSQPSLGEFGRYERAPSVDKTREIARFVTAGDGEVLAVPSSQSINEGISAHYYDLFVRTHSDELPGNPGPWRYAGNVDAGSDNADGCATDAIDAKTLPPCVSSKGAIAFQAAGDALPQIAVAMTGTEISGPGQVRTLDGGDRALYRYDDKTQAYRPTAAR